MGDPGTKAGKALRAVAKGELLNEISILEERVLRKHGRLLDGRVIYAMFNKEFAKDARLARPLALQELQQVTAKESPDCLRNYMSK